MNTVTDEGGQPSRSLIRLFGSFLRLGLSAFGGPAMIAYICKLAVEEKGWLDQETFQDGVVLCQTIPGATAMQMAAYVGLKTRGVRGALCSYVGFGLPAFLIMLALSYGYQRSHALPVVVSVFSGLQAIVVALVANAAYTFGKNALKQWQSMLIALAAGALFWFMVSPILVILLAALLGTLLTPRKPDARGLPRLKQAPHRLFPLLSLVLAAAAGFVLLFFIRRDLFTLACLISKIDLMAFGGGFASIPLMFHEMVEVRGWMNATTFLDGIALGQFTPGPIVITATFIGFMVKGLKGVALRGLYSYIRHPQYLGLALTGLGLSILWPRFLVVALWALMVGVYYLLARDEQGRMLRQFGDEYRSYMDRTGMFLPKSWEAAFAKVLPTIPPLRAWLGFLILTAGSLGGAFALRSYTLAHLPIWSNGPVSVLAILPGDMVMLDNRMASVLELPEIKAHLGEQGPVLAYLMPKDYVMQGMIADTGGEWQLYKRHHTLAMISDWILHPFRHLENGHAAMHHGMGMGQGAQNGMARRLIFLRVDAVGGQTDPAALFGINLHRSPLFLADVEMHTLVVQEIRDLPADTGWRRVPTPVF